MTQISLSKALTIIDKHRGIALKEKRMNKGGEFEAKARSRLNLLNYLKKEFTDLLDTDEPPLGL